MLLLLPPPLDPLQWKVRRTLAFSIHELALILGDQLTAEDLVPIFNGFLKDLDEVRIGVLRHLYDFLKVCDFIFLFPGRVCTIRFYVLLHSSHVQFSVLHYLASVSLLYICR